MRMVTEQPKLSTRRLSEAVLESVADIEGVDPVDLDYPLYDALDPDALDALFRTGGGYVTFSYHGYVVTAFANGTVDIDTHDPEVGSTAHA